MSRGGPGRGNLGRRTRQVLRVMLDVDRPMYSREIADRIPDLRTTDVTTYLQRLRARGWVVSTRNYGHGAGGMRLRTYNRLTEIGRAAALEALARPPVPAQRTRTARRPAPQRTVLRAVPTAGELAERCRAAADVLVERGHLDRAEPERALRDVAVVLTALGRGLADDPTLSGRFLSLAKSCELAADRWATGSSDPGRDRDVTWQTLRAVTRVLRELSAERPVAASR